MLDPWEDGNLTLTISLSSSPSLSYEGGETVTSEAQDGVSGIPEGEEADGSAVNSQPPVGGAASDAPPPSEPSVLGGDAASPTKQLSGDISVTGQDQSVKDSDVKASLDSLRKAGGVKGAWHWLKLVNFFLNFSGVSSIYRLFFLFFFLLIFFMIRPL